MGDKVISEIHGITDSTFARNKISVSAKAILQNKFSSKLNIVDSYGQNSTVVVIRIFILTENKDSFFIENINLELLPVSIFWAAEFGSLFWETGHLPLPKAIILS